jgi:preprotein translocase subunit SecY
MPFCSNPDCPHKEKTGNFAEYQDGITHCPDCGSRLTDTPVDLPGHVEKIDSDFINKILITIGLLALFRVLCLIPLPGVDLSALFNDGSKNFFGFFNFSRISICALGIMPYISAYIFVEIFSLVIPSLKKWRSQKREGRRKLFITARWLTLLLCIIQGYGIAISLERMTLPGGSLVVSSTGVEFRLIVVITLTACTFVALWIADQITTRGIGNGISMLIFTGLAITLFSNLVRLFSETLLGGILMEATVTIIIFMLLILFLAAAFIVFIEKGESNIKVKLRNSRLVDLPIKYNTAGVLPASFAASIVMIPATLMTFGSYHKFYEYFQYGTLTYFITYIIITIILFLLFTSLFYDPDEITSFLEGKNAEPILQEDVSFEKLLDKKLTLFAIGGTVYLLVYSVLLSPSIHAFIVISGLSLIRIVSISLDILNEVEARKNGYFVKIDEFQKPYQAKFIKNLLELNSIPCFLEGYHHRSLLYFFGPFIEISLYVKRDKESEALNIISEL